MMKEKDGKKGLKEEKMKELVKEEGGRVRLSKIGSLNLSQMLLTFNKYRFCTVVAENFDDFDQ